MKKRDGVADGLFIIMAPEGQGIRLRGMNLCHRTVFFFFVQRSLNDCIGEWQSMRSVYSQKLTRQERICEIL